MYTIGQVSEMFDLPISTLRFYDKSGLMPDLERRSGIRQFHDDDIERIRVIECLKKSGMEIKDIRVFMEWCSEGSSTYGKRLEMFRRQKEAVEEKMEQLQRTLSMIQFKCWYYEQAMADGSEDRIKAMLPDSLPEEIQGVYDYAHERDETGSERMAYAG